MRGRLTFLLVDIPQNTVIHPVKKMTLSVTDKAGKIHSVTETIEAIGKNNVTR